MPTTTTTDQLIVATNENNILDRFFSTNAMNKEPVVPTITPSMDIVISSNFERFLYYVSGNNCDLLRDWMQVCVCVVLYCIS